MGFIYFSFFPIVLIVGIIAIKSFDKLLYLLAFLTPLSINLSYFTSNSPIDISIFTEPILILLLLILTFKAFLYSKKDIKVIKHPITISIFFFIFWIFITSITSTMPVVSFKFFASKTWFIIPVFFFGITLFKKIGNVKTFIWAYAIGLLIVFIYSTIKLGQVSLMSANFAHRVVKPFYNDHTAYGAILALFTPVMWAMAFSVTKKPQIKIVAIFFATAFTIGIVLSYSRAAWIGMVAVVGVLVLIKLKIKFRYLLIVTLAVSFFLFAFWFQIIDSLEKNNQDSSSNLSSHLSSMTNISTDASNVERLNRWYCAIEMFKEKPLVGWGPGTYQFKYAPFQLERMRTIISTNFGDVGNAHSEYLNSLAEQGLLGILAFITLAINILITGFKVFRSRANKTVRYLSLSITLGFITYFIHAFLNNFLDSDKLAIPFFGFAAILVAFDIYHKKSIQ